MLESKKRGEWLGGRGIYILLINLILFLIALTFLTFLIEEKKILFAPPEDSEPPAVKINFPIVQNYTISSIEFNISMNESGSCMYSLNSGIDNISMEDRGGNMFYAENSTIEDGAYKANYYCSDIAGNFNNSVFAEFGVNATYLTFCKTIGIVNSGVTNRNYYLARDIVASGENCIFFNDASNIVLDGLGHWIKDIDLGSTGIGMTLCKNVTIRNINISIGDGKGIVLMGVNDSLIENVNLVGNRMGIAISYSINNTFRNNIFDKNNISIYISAPSMYTFNSEGGENAFDNNFINNSLGDAIVINVSSNNSFENMNILNTNPSFYDFKFYRADKNYLIDMINIGNYTFLDNGNLAVFENTKFGEIRFLPAVNGSGNNLTNDIIIENNSIIIQGNEGLNRSANITLYEMGARFENPKILKNGAVCGECYNFTSLSADKVMFNISSWGNYKISGNKISFIGVNINEPINDRNYGNSSSLLVNHTITNDSTIEGAWYSLDRGNNFSIPMINMSKIFYLNLAEGEHNLEIMARNIYGKNASAEVLFTINNSLPYCGDENCDNKTGWESCKTCPDDCGSCPINRPDSRSPTTTPKINKPAADTKTAGDSATSGAGTTAPAGLRIIDVSDEAVSVSVKGGESITLRISNGAKDYDAVVEISGEKIKLSIDGKNYLIANGKIDSILLEEREVYVGVSELKKDSATIIVGLDKNAVKEKLSNQVNLGLVIIIIAFSIAIVIVLILLIYFLRERNESRQFEPLNIR